jgi:hypothetical protein
VMIAMLALPFLGGGSGDSAGSHPTEGSELLAMSDDSRAPAGEAITCALLGNTTSLLARIAVILLLEDRRCPPSTPAPLEPANLTRSAAVRVSGVDWSASPTFGGPTRAPSWMFCRFGSTYSNIKLRSVKTPQGGKAAGPVGPQGPARSAGSLATQGPTRSPRASADGALRPRERKGPVSTGPLWPDVQLVRATAGAPAATKSAGSLTTWGPTRAP